MLKDFISDEQGQDMVEYSLLLVLIAAAAILAITALGVRITEVLSGITNKLDSAGSSAS